MPPPPRSDHRSWSLTAHLLASQQPLYKSATQHPFLLAGAEGRLSKKALSRWLATDRLYLHSYIRGAGRLLASLDFPTHVPQSGEGQAFETRLADWLIEALVAIRREERLFVEVSERYGLGLEIAVPFPPSAAGAAATITSGNGTTAQDNDEFTGLTMMRSIFSSVGSGPLTTSAAAAAPTNPPPPLPWLEGALTFWGTERCYLDAWTFAAERAGERSEDAQDADGGALRKEFIPNWSADGFREFVEKLGVLIDDAVGKVLEAKEGEEAERVKAEILARVEGKWKTLLEAERAFWPDV